MPREKLKNRSPRSPRSSPRRTRRRAVETEPAPTPPATSSPEATKPELWVAMEVLRDQMIDNRLFCNISDCSVRDREQERLLVLAHSGLWETSSLAVFEEALQTASQVLSLGVGWVGFMGQENLSLKAVVGLHHLGLMNPLAARRTLSREDAFCSMVVDSNQPLVLGDTHGHPAFMDSFLTQRYGIRAYVGVPLVLSTGHTLGTLALMDTQPHDFEPRDVHILQMFARWCMSEVERDRLLEHHGSPYPVPVSNSAMWAELGMDPPPSLQSARIQTPPPARHPAFVAPIAASTAPLKARLRLTRQLAEQLNNPLTSVLGMTNILRRGIYGSLTPKQQEYLTVIQDSGQTLRLWGQEILELADLEDLNTPLQLLPLDVETLCEQVVHNVQDVMLRLPVAVQISSSPGERLWNLDRDKVRKIIYNAVHGLMQIGADESQDQDHVLRIHLSHRQGEMGQSIFRFTLWLAKTWADDGLTGANLGEAPLLPLPMDPKVEWATLSALDAEDLMPDLAARLDSNAQAVDKSSDRPGYLRLLLCQYWAERHGGMLLVQSSGATGSHYVIDLPTEPIA